MSKNKKVILIYPYFNGISGAYNRYLLLEKLLKKENFKVKLIILKEKKYSSIYIKILEKSLKFLIVELLILYYAVLRNHNLITDFNPSIIALFSKNVFVQIHDVSWVNINFARNNFLLYQILKSFIKYYQNILTVSKTSMIAINKISARKKKTFFLYNSVNESFIKESNNIGKDNNIFEKSDFAKNLNLNIPTISYIATLIPRKCHFELIEALSKTNISFNVFLVGLPNDNNVFEFIKKNKSFNSKNNKSNIYYYPEISQKDLCYLLLFSSAYISTAMDEGFGIPVLEAHLYNTPLVIRDIDINRELFPKAIFFNSSFQLSKILDNLTPLSKNEIIEKQRTLSNLKQGNLPNLFSYCLLSKKLKAEILN